MDRDQFSNAVGKANALKAREANIEEAETLVSRKPRPESAEWIETEGAGNAQFAQRFRGWGLWDEGTLKRGRKS
jgi:hypothetical protein